MRPRTSVLEIAQKGLAIHVPSSVSAIIRAFAPSGQAVVIDRSDIEVIRIRANEMCTKNIDHLAAIATFRKVAVDHGGDGGWGSGGGGG
jgi:hypothetical protein